MMPAELDQALRDPDAEVRRRAVIELARSATADVTTPVVTALGDEDWRVRKEAVRVAVTLAERAGLVPALVAAICQGNNVGLRNSALEALGELGRLSTEPLLEALDSARPEARKFILAALGDTRDPRAVPALVASTRGDDANEATAAIDALARIGGSDAEAALRECLKSSGPFQRMGAIDALVRLGTVVPWDELSPLLADRLLRRVALPLLGRTGRPEAATALVDALAEPSAHVVAVAALALAKIQESSPACRDVIAQRMRATSPHERARLVERLEDGDLPTRQAVVDLLLLARDSRALEGLAELAAQNAFPPGAVDALRAWGDEVVESLISVHLGLHGSARGAALEMAADMAAAAPNPSRAVVESVRAALRTALDDPETSIQLAAARSMSLWAEGEDAKRLVALTQRGELEVAAACGEALSLLMVRHPEAVARAVDGVALEGAAGVALAPVVARVGGPKALEALQTALSAGDPETRKAAVEALASVGDRAAAELIEFALADESFGVQSVAARALGRFRDSQGRPVGTDALLLALASDSPAVQAAAARALGEAGDGRAVEPLRELVRAGDPGVAVAAMEALRALHDPTLADVLVEALGHADDEVVKQSLRAIRETDHPRTEARLSVGLEHAAWHVRVVAARLLGEIGGEAARAALEARLEVEKDDLVSAAIREALDADALVRGDA